MGEEKALARAQDLSEDLVRELASILHTDLDALKNASLVTRQWTYLFQRQLFKSIRVRKPTDDPDENKLQDILAEPQADQERILSMIRILYLGRVYDLDEPDMFRYTVVHRSHIPILAGMINLTSLHFCSATFAWDRLSDAELDGFLLVLSLPNLHEVSFFCFPGCYMPLSFFLFSPPSFARLEIKDISPEPVSEAHSNPLYGELMDRLQGLRPHISPSLSLSDLKLEGLGLIANFVEFISDHGVGWSSPVLPAHLDLDFTDTYSPLNENKPDQMEIAGRFLGQFGTPVKNLRLHTERDLLRTTLLGEELNDVLATGLGVLQNLDSLDLSLMINTTVATNPYSVLAFARSCLRSVMRHIPQCNTISHLRITCQFSLALVDRGDQNPEIQERYIDALNQDLWPEFDHIVQTHKYSSVSQWEFHAIFYCADSLNALRYNPALEIGMSGIPVSEVFLPLKENGVVDHSISIQWDDCLV